MRPWSKGWQFFKPYLTQFRGGRYQLCPYKMNGLSTATGKKRPLPCRLWKRGLQPYVGHMSGLKEWSPQIIVAIRWRGEKNQSQYHYGKAFFTIVYHEGTIFHRTRKKTTRDSQPMQKGPWHVVEVWVLGLTKFSVVSDQLCMNGSFFVSDADTWHDYKELHLLPAVYKRFCETRETEDIKAVEMDNVMLMKWFVEYSILSRASLSWGVPFSGLFPTVTCSRHIFFCNGNNFLAKSNNSIRPSESIKNVFIFLVPAAKQHVAQNCFL